MILWLMVLCLKEYPIRYETYELFCLVINIKLF